MNEKAEMKDRLRVALDLREKKAVDLARDLKIPKSAISQYLSGYRTIKDSKRLYIIAEYLNVSEAWLMGFDVPIERHIAKIEEKPAKMAERHFEMIIDEDLAEIFEEFKTLDATKKKLVKDLVHSLAETEA